MGLQQTSIRYRDDDSYSHFYLCNYLPGSVGRDTFSNSLLNFKRGEHPDLEGWIDCTLEESTGMPIREGTIILRALHHHEPSVDPLRAASLDLLGEALADRFKCRYLPGLLCKSRPVEEIKRLTREQRESALHEAYRFTVPAPYDHPGHRDHPPHYLVLDDIVTTGSTMNAIVEAIRREYPSPALPLPCSTYSSLSPDSSLSPLSTHHSPLTTHALSIFAFSLAKADYDASFNLFHRLQGRNYLLEQGAQWLLAEEEATYRPDYSIQTVRNWIRENSFPQSHLQ